jgi:NAD(P)-dependent dehydrogenase (short-subunit alcohol dehydrogenase family)
VSAQPALRDKVALVAGGSRGIGAAVARRLAALGAQVAVTYKSRRDAAESVVSDIVTAGGTAFALEADVSEPEVVDTLVGEVVAFGPRRYPGEQCRRRSVSVTRYDGRFIRA